MTTEEPSIKDISEFYADPLQVGEITKIQPGDYLLLRYNERPLTGDEATQVKEKVVAALGDQVKVLIFGSDLDPYLLHPTNGRTNAQ